MVQPLGADNSLSNLRLWIETFVFLVGTEVVQRTVQPCEPDGPLDWTSKLNPEPNTIGGSDVQTF